MDWRSPWIPLVIALGAGSAHAHSVEPAPRSAQAPAGEGVAAGESCLSCHAGAPLDPEDGGEIELHGLPEHYIPGHRYTLTFAIRHPGADRLRWGFRLTAVAPETRREAGTLVVTDRVNTRKIRGPADREYVVHTYAGTAVGKPGGQSWSFEWVAPATDVGEVAFFTTAVAADADGSEAGDLVYGRAPDPLTVVAGPEAETSASPAIPHELE
jgi:hypothetical protein